MIFTINGTISSGFYTLLSFAKDSSVASQTLASRSVDLYKPEG